MVLLAKEEPGGVSGLVWEKGGAEGAIEVSPRDASVLLSITGNDFFEVSAKPAAKEVKEVKSTKPKAAAEEITSDDLAQALAATSSTPSKSKE